MTDRIVRWMSGGLLAIGAIYLATGYSRLASQGRLTDMAQRVKGLTLILAGHHPYVPDHSTVGDAPWAWLGNQIVYWPQQPWPRAYYGLLILGVLLLMAWWGYRVGSTVSRSAGVLLAASTVAISSVCTALGLGQNSPFVIAALIGCYLLAQRGHRVLAGMCLGFALAKPQIAGLFALPFLVTGQFAVLAAAAGYLVVATLAACWMSGVSPVEWLTSWSQFIAGAARWPGYGPYQVLVDAGVLESVALTVTAVLFGGLALIAIYALRTRPLIVLFAIAAVAGRLWSYHQLYDNLMLVFLLMAAGAHATRTNTWQAFGIFVAVGLTVWLPGRACDVTVYQWFQMITWVYGAVAVAKARWLLPAAGEWPSEPQMLAR